MMSVIVAPRQPLLAAAEVTSAPCHPAPPPPTGASRLSGRLLLRRSPLAEELERAEIARIRASEPSCMVGKVVRMLRGGVYGIQEITCTALDVQGRLVLQLGDARLALYMHQISGSPPSDEEVDRWVAQDRWAMDGARP